MTSIPKNMYNLFKPHLCDFSEYSASFHDIAKSKFEVYKDGIKLNDKRYNVLMLYICPLSSLSH